MLSVYHLISSYFIRHHKASKAPKCSVSLSLSVSLPEIMIASKRRRRSRRNRSSFEIFSFSSFSSFLWREGEILSLSLSLSNAIWQLDFPRGRRVGRAGKRKIWSWRFSYNRAWGIFLELFFGQGQKKADFLLLPQKALFLLSPCVLKNVSVWSEMAFTEEERGWIVFQYLFPSFFPLSSFSWP